jgi:hypothetical protein
MQTLPFPQQNLLSEKIIFTQKDILVTDINCQGNVFLPEHMMMGPPPPHGVEQA